MNTDAELLRRYVEEHCEAAFTELVQRHIGLVYGIALRRVGGDAHLTEDVAQQVFCDLARKASSLFGRATLSGWLYAGAHVASAAAVRADRRRKQRESNAYIMHTTPPSTPDDDGARLRPLLDDAIVSLDTAEREALALRFLEQRTFADVGAALCVTEEAARKRVDRALDKLRNVLRRRGVTSTAAALGLALATTASVSAPAGLGAKIASHALAGAGAAASSSMLGTLAATSWPAAAVLVLGGLVLGAQRNANAHLRAELAQLAAPGETLADLRKEVRQLARTVAEADTLRQHVSQPVTPRPDTSPPPRAFGAPRAIGAHITVTNKGTLAFDGSVLTLAEFIQKLRDVTATIDPGARLHVSALGAQHASIAYVVDEARKAGIKHLTVEADAMPDPKVNGWWF